MISAADIAFIGYWSEADVGWTSKVQPSKVRIPTLFASILELLVELLESTPSKVRIPTLLASILELLVELVDLAHSKVRIPTLPA